MTPPNPKNFWQNLPKPFFALAPMADVTDVVFRQLFVKYGKPDVLWTEFVSCDGLCSAGREIILRDLAYNENERPIVAQIFGGNTENCFKTAQLIAELGFDGIDINMGCPDRSVEKQGAGASLIKNPKQAQEIVRAVQLGSGGLPVSVKTRTGYNKDEIDTWIAALLETNLSALTVHGRTRKEMSLVDARWDDISRVVKMAKDTGTIIIGNGDVTSLEDARHKAETYGVDGVMVGRGAFGNPWFFNPNRQKSDVSLEEQLQVMVEHVALFQEKLGDIKNFAVMKKHFKAYVTGFDGAKELRVKLMDTGSAQEVKEVVDTFLRERGGV
jgi:nifR3 family TIM-barrel protein